MSTTIEPPNRIAQREEQVRQAEEVLASLPQKSGVAKGLFDGRFVADWVFPYPQLPERQRNEVAQTVGELERFCDAHLDPVQIDRDVALPREGDGRGFSQMGYCRLLEVIGSRCSTTGIFVNAHHSIGMRGLLLFGTEE